MTRFLQDVAGVLEVDKVELGDDFRSYPGWCSLQGFGLMVLLENDWKAPVKLTRFLTLHTVRDLAREAFLAFVAARTGVSRETLSGQTPCASLPGWGEGLFAACQARFGGTCAECKVLEDFLK